MTTITRAEHLLNAANDVSRRLPRHVELGRLAAATAGGEGRARLPPAGEHQLEELVAAGVEAELPPVLDQLVGSAASVVQLIWPGQAAALAVPGARRLTLTRRHAA
jgi:hypothetical protein